MRRYEFLLKNEFGDPLIFDSCYVLDPTHPDGEKFLRETYTYLKECGFSFYKLDFVSYLLEGETFYDKNAGPYDAIRKMLSIIRECVGNESHIMGCNLPYGTGYGYVDSRRYGLDIHNTFGHLIKCMEVALPQMVTNGYSYQGDLDYLVVRGEETSAFDKFNVINPTKNYWKTHKYPDHFVWRCGDDFSYNEAKMWCILELISGSSLFLSDRLTKLNEKGLHLIKTTLENAKRNICEPIDYFENKIPSCWINENTIAIINTKNRTKKFVINKIENGEYEEIFSKQIYKINFI